jgi:putative hydrolase of the HAD superfamily
VRPSAILFDLDDTILQCEGGDHLKLWMKSVEKFGHLFAGANPSAFFNEIRNVAEEFWNDPDRHRTGRLDIRKTRHNIVSKAARNLNHPNDTGAVKLADHYHDTREFNVKPFSGALETLSHFRDTPIKTALITNGSSDVQRSKIDKFGLDRYFDLVLIEGEFGMGKPNHKVYSHIVSELGVTAEDSWIVGDNLVGEVSVPQQLGFFAVWNDHRGTGLPQDTDIVPDKIITAISELVGMVGIVKSNNETA